MQKIVFKALLFSAMVAFVSCDNEEDNSAPFFQIDATSVNVRESGIFNREILLSTNITKFEVAVDPTTGKDESGEFWCSAEVKNNLLVITCKENPIYDPRETDLTLKPEGMQAVKIHILQLGQAAIILPSQTDFPLSFLEETISFDIVSNVDYDLVVPEWIKEVPSTKAPETATSSYQFTIELNEDPVERVDTIYFKQKDIDEAQAKIAKVVIKQKPNMPSPIINSKAETSVNDEGVASITISWDEFPAEEYVKAIEVSYKDPKVITKAEDGMIVETLPATTTSYTVENTFKKYGEYEFSVRAINTYDNAGEPIIIKTISDRVPHVPGDVTGETKLNLADTEASSNAQEPNEGPLENLFDGKTDNFFHSAWSFNAPAPHWIQVQLPKTLTDHFKIKTTPRNGNNIPTDIDLYGSKNGKDWFLIKNITKGGENAPYTSDPIRIMSTFSYLRFSVNETNTETVFWSMAELEVFDLTTEVISDPEAE